MGRQVRSQKPDKLTPEDLAGPEGWYGVPALTGSYASRPRLTALLDARPDDAPRADQRAGRHRQDVRSRPTG